VKKSLFTCLLALVLVSMGNAQDYKNGLGLRVGVYNGFTVKHMLGPKSALEGIISTRWKGIGITGLYEFHNTLFNSDQLRWYAGLGGHVGFYNGDNASWGSPGTSYSVVGFDAILGLEFCFSDVPISLDLDWKPAFNFWGYKGVWADEVTFAMRYIF
jgi:hypothetical protein